MPQVAGGSVCFEATPERRRGFLRLPGPQGEIQTILIRLDIYIIVYSED